MIKDSGSRRSFPSGAVRDIQEGKGRCDLLPLDVVGEYMNDVVVGCLGQFQREKTSIYLENALAAFRKQFNGIDDGARNADMLLEVSRHFEDGANKYGEDNWQKGIPVHCYIDSAVRHYLKFLRGDNDERHDRAFVWNILCAIWTCKHYPELNDIDRNRADRTDSPQGRSKSNPSEFWEGT